MPAFDGLGFDGGAFDAPGTAPAGLAVLLPRAIVSATSSALRLGDLALVWYAARGHGDLKIVDGDLASDVGLTTAVMLSVMLDRRAEDDDVPPSGVDSDRRGWWADEFLPTPGDRIGSRLWLLDRAKLDSEARILAREYTAEALAWLLEDRVASSVDVEVEISKTPVPSIFIAAAIRRPGREQITYRFARRWSGMTEGA